MEILVKEKNNEDSILRLKSISLCLQQLSEEASDIQECELASCTMRATSDYLEQHIRKLSG